jgi:hypothetical protein
MVPKHYPDHRKARLLGQVTPIRLGATVAVLSLAVIGVAVAAPRTPSPVAAPVATPNPACTVAVPADPLSANGLATPYRLRATDPAAGPCNEANPVQSAFVEATVLDPATGALSVYRPLVIDDGTAPAAPPVVPVLPAGAVVGLWFGSNGGTLTLGGTGGSLRTGQCVNGVAGSPFGQFAQCGAARFFAATGAAERAGKLTVPALGVARDGRPCPTTRDFSLVDQDQSDNVTTTYLATPDGRTAQDGTAGSARLGPVTTLANGSDNRLLDAFVDPAFGCTPFTAKDLTTGAGSTTSLALNELQAAAHQAAPVALVPLGDPMTLVGGSPNVRKTNLYRAGVDQPALNSRTDTTRAYCRDLRTVGLPRLTADRTLLRNAASPDSATGVGLLRFLTLRLRASLQLLGCTQHTLTPPDPADEAAAKSAVQTLTTMSAGA